jgi:hypothetical protein
MHIKILHGEIFEFPEFFFCLNTFLCKWQCHTPCFDGILVDGFLFELWHFCDFESVCLLGNSSSSHAPPPPTEGCKNYAADQKNLRFKWVGAIVKEG